MIVAPSSRGLTSVLFDPLGWLPSTCLALVVPSQWHAHCQASRDSHLTPWINQAVIDAHRLDCTLVDAALDANSQAWIQAWPYLRRAAYLAGCRCLRDEIVAAGHFARLDPIARHFALLPLVVPRPCAAVRESLRTDPATLTAQGFVCLIQRAARSSERDAAIPLALRQRLHLMFSDVQALLGHLAPASSEGASAASFPTLFDRAIAHAQIHQNARAS